MVVAVRAPEANTTVVGEMVAPVVSVGVMVTARLTGALAVSVSTAVPLVAIEVLAGEARMENPVTTARVVRATGTVTVEDVSMLPPIAKATAKVEVAVVPAVTLTTAVVALGANTMLGMVRALTGVLVTVGTIVMARSTATVEVRVSWVVVEPVAMLVADAVAVIT